MQQGISVPGVGNQPNADTGGHILMIALWILLALVPICLLGIAALVGPLGPPLVAGMSLVGAILGFGSALLFGRISRAGIAAGCGIAVKDIKTHKLEPHPGIFLLFSATVVCFYIGFIYLAAASFLPDVGSDRDILFPIPVAGAFMSMFTLFGLAFCAIRYAGYIRLLSCFKQALDDATASPDIIRPMRERVFRYDQMFEPPGTAFVTLGITATFLGLAVGLVGLDLPAMFGVAANETNARDAARAFRSFAGCMGLALGMSMLGVITSFAAQWLRGCGPSEATEDLLKRADGRLGVSLAKVAPSPC